MRLSEAEQRVLAARLTVRNYPRGAVLVAAGAMPSGVWIIYSGTVESAVGHGAGRAVVEVLRAGDIAGDLPLLLGGRPVYTARVVNPCGTFHVPATAFRSLLAERPVLMQCWLSHVASRLARCQVRLIGLLGRTLPEQAARLLLAEADGSQVVLPQRTLAAMLGVQRSSLNRVLREFEREGVILIDYCKITIAEPEALGRIAKGAHALRAANSA